MSRPSGDGSDGGDLPAPASPPRDGTRPGDPPPRVLVAGMGNVLHEDDGFGVRVAERLAEEGVPDGVAIREVGIGGIHLVQELMAGYDVFVLVDTVDRGKEPGEVFLLEPEVPEADDLTEAERESVLADTHYTVPSKVLVMAKALDALPSRSWILGCQPASVELGLDMGAETARAVDEAVTRIRRIFRELGLAAKEPTSAEDPEERSRSGRDAAGRIGLRDEILQMMYWMKGERLAEEAAPTDLEAFLAGRADPSDLEREMETLADNGLLERCSGGRYRLSEDGDREGGRRFADEFEGMTGQAHGECADPECECHTDPVAAVECRSERLAAGHGS